MIIGTNVRALEHYTMATLCTSIHFVYPVARRFHERALDAR
jgi:hypothetical protein